PPEVGRGIQQPSARVRATAGRWFHGGGERSERKVGGRTAGGESGRRRSHPAGEARRAGTDCGSGRRPTRRCSGGREARCLYFLSMPLTAPLNVGVRRITRLLIDMVRLQSYTRP